MKVSLCMQVFSHQVGSLMKGIAMWGAADRTNLDPSAVDTAQLILFLDKLFDSLNSNSKVAPSTKPLKGGVTESSEHEEFWKMAIKVLETMKFYNSKKLTFVTVPSLKNLIQTIKGFFNQDPLENFFSYIRSHGVRNVSPGPTHFSSSFKTLLVNNFLCHHSPFANCEEDSTTQQLANLKTFLISDVPTEHTDLQALPDLDADLINIVPIHKKTKIGKCTITYYAGYVAKKIYNVISKYNCEICKKNLLIGTGSDTDFIEAREYRPQLFLRPGGVLRFIVNGAVPLLYFFIPRLAHKKSFL